MATEKLLRGNGIHPSGPYADLYSNRKEHFLSIKGDVVKIDFQPVERFLVRGFDLYSTRTWVLIIIALGFFAFWAILKVNSNTTPRMRAEYRAMKAVGLAD